VEITLDLAYVRQILNRERTAARDEISRLGVMRALEQSQPRHDLRIASADDVGTLACREGCTWCCHFTVDVRPAEVFAILDFVDRTFAADERTRIHEELRRNSITLAGLDQEDRVTRNLQCPFLSRDRCTIYSVRPQSCRNYHATDVAGCRQSYEQPDNLDIDPEFAPVVYQAGAAHVEGFSLGVQDAGFDVDAYELNGALHAALSDPGARGRFEARQKPFTGLEGEEVPLEFDDLS
jgi:Fe-S-cluster containining protein